MAEERELRRAASSGASQDWAMAIKRGLNQVAESQRAEQKSCTIFRVDRQQREKNPRHFGHEIISLGLYDRSTSDWDKPNTEADTCRLEMVNGFLADLGKTVDDWDDICAKVVEQPQDMQRLYYGHDHLQTETISSVLTVDGIFLACFLGTCFARKFAADEFPSVHHAFKLNLQRKNPTLSPRMLLDDIIKLENQVPLCVIRNVLKLAIQCGKLDNTPKFVFRSGDREEAPTAVRNERVSKMADQTLDDLCYRTVTLHYHRFLPGYDSSSAQEDKSTGFHGCLHLLDCLYCAMLVGNLKPEEKPQKALTSTPRYLQPSCGWLDRRQNSQAGTPHHQVKLRRRTKEQGSTQLVSAKELVEAGIHFHGRPGGFTDVEFKVHTFKATLFLPIIDDMRDGCEPLWRNFMAYEVATPRSGDLEFMAYVEFMVDLIDTEEDVAVLRKGKYPVILDVGLQDNQAVADMFNSMLTDRGVKRSSKWVVLRRQINDYYSKAKQTPVEFVRTYFSR